MNVREKPVVSVITISFNEQNSIENTIKSVLNQRYKNIEYVVVDGGSTDATPNLINKYINQITRFISEPDKGIFDAMNKGLLFATGEWIIFMNAGDQFYDDNVIERIFENEIDPSISMIYGDVCLYGDNDLYYFKSKTNKTKINLNAICHQAVLIKKSIHPKFDLSFRLSADHHLIYQIFKSKPCLYVNLVIAKVLIGGVSSNLTETRKEKLRISKEHGSAKDKALAYVFYVYGSVKHLAKYTLIKFFPTSFFASLREFKNRLEEK